MEEKDQMKFHVGEYIRSNRKENNMTQGELARIVGTSEKYIGQIERGEKFPSFQLFIKLHIHLGISFDYVAKEIKNQCNIPNLSKQIK
ncbi:helix-turn-helix domain-containing protein [Sediminibacillus massiliensis]|uniref:helix-turn-helix domain-containing protein n=1 Tax=Sediminibacillus massiliensis TaxID=1926277 RepID=UPI0009886224|nr:helix-turn-helix transcriptional regulator [Sediminibacillus massiliensis]